MRNEFVAPVNTPKLINLGEYSAAQLENLYQTMAAVFSDFKNAYV